MINDNGMTINTPKLIFISAQTTRRGSHISNVDVRGIKKNKKIKPCDAFAEISGNDVGNHTCVLPNINSS